MAIPLSQLPPSFHARGRSRDFPVIKPVNRVHLPQTQTPAHGGTAVPRLSTTRPAVIGKTRRQATRNEFSMSTTLRELEWKQEEREEDQAAKTDEQDPNQDLAHRWREVNGADDWVGMLDPIDPLLRSELIRYGELAQACYDAFDSDPFSKYCGTSKYEADGFFDCLGLAGMGYEAPLFLYSTANVHIPRFFMKSLSSGGNWSEHANWIGYVAVSGDEATARLGRRDIVVAWRGTVTRLEWVKDLMVSMGPLKLVGIPSRDSSVKAEWGFISLYVDKHPDCKYCEFSARDQVVAEVGRLVRLYTKRKEEVSITVTGHSLGSALAVLSAYDLAESKANVGADGREAPVCVFSFSGPRVGNPQFRERFEELGVKALRVVNVHDLVPYAPGLLVNEHVPLPVQRVAEWLHVASNYSHVGVELALDHTHSPFLKETPDPASFHNLEVHLHLLDGYHGKGERFKLSSRRDYALVNKASNFLKDHYLIPPYWRQDENKGMIRNRDGHWMKRERPRIDDDRPDFHHHLVQLGLVSDH